MIAPRQLPLALLALAIALTLASTADAGRRTVPRGWMGMVGDGPLMARSVDLQTQVGHMVTHGVETLRLPFIWSITQPYESFADVPEDQRNRFDSVNGVPTDFSAIDRMVTAAAMHRMPIMPSVVRTPVWARTTPSSVSSAPRDPATFGRFMRALVRRYGPGGRFWARHPELPRMAIRDWQVWNEPNLGLFWYEQPWAKGYTALLRVARREIRRVDHSARIVLGALVFRSWLSMEELYKAGGGRLFDEAAVHPYTGKLDNVVKIIARNRDVMKRHGDARKWLAITEMAWTSGRGVSGFNENWESTPSGQAVALKRAYERLATLRTKYRLSRVYWYTWVSDEQPTGTFNWAGLLRVASDGSFESKPAEGAYVTVARKLEGCAKRTIFTCR